MICFILKCMPFVLLQRRFAIDPSIFTIVLQIPLESIGHGEENNTSTSGLE